MLVQLSRGSCKHDKGVPTVFRDVTEVSMSYYLEGNFEGTKNKTESSYDHLALISFHRFKQRTREQNAVSSCLRHKNEEN